MTASGVVLDTGALIAFERNDRRVVMLLRRAVDRSLAIVVPAGVVAQCWRNGARQARLATLLGDSAVTVRPLDVIEAERVGQLLGVAKRSDTVDGAVAVAARVDGARRVVVTSDPDDITHLDDGIPVVAV